MKKADAFKKEYEKLCKRHGISVVGVPQFIASEDGSWRVAVTLQMFESKEEK